VLYAKGHALNGKNRALQARFFAFSLLIFYECSRKYRQSVVDWQRVVDKSM
jgi:hypothetical protein